MAWWPWGLASDCKAEFKGGKMWLSLGEWTLTLPISISGPVVFLHFFPKKLQSPIMRSYVKCCKIQVPPSGLSKLLWILLHIVMQSWGFAGFYILKGCLSRGLLLEECNIRGQTHPLHAWQKFEITVVVSRSCIKCVLMCFKSLSLRGKTTNTILTFIKQTLSL